MCTLLVHSPSFTFSQIKLEYYNICITRNFCCLQYFLVKYKLYFLLKTFFLPNGMFPFKNSNTEAIGSCLSCLMRNMALKLLFKHSYIVMHGYICMLYVYVYTVVTYIIYCFVKT